MRCGFPNLENSAHCSLEDGHTEPLNWLGQLLHHQEGTSVWYPDHSTDPPIDWAFEDEPRKTGGRKVIEWLKRLFGVTNRESVPSAGTSSDSTPSSARDAAGSVPSGAPASPFPDVKETRVVESSTSPASGSDVQVWDEKLPTPKRKPRGRVE